MDPKQIAFNQAKGYTMKTSRTGVQRRLLGFFLCLTLILGHIGVLRGSDGVSTFKIEFQTPSSDGTFVCYPSPISFTATARCTSDDNVLGTIRLDIQDSVGNTVGHDASFTPPFPDTYICFAHCDEDPSASAVISITSVEVADLGLVSGAIKPDTSPANTWVTVRDTYIPTTYVKVKALFNPDTLDPDALPEGLITWTGGEEVTSMSYQRKVPKNVSAHTKLTASCGGATPVEGNVWILWSSVEIKMTGQTPDGAVPYYDYMYDQTQDLGAKLYTNLSGCAAVGKYVAIGHITPPGVNEVVSDGWALKRDVEYIMFEDGASKTSTPWGCDDSLANWTSLVPDADDCIYDTDGPNLGKGPSAQSSRETYDNFCEWVEWNGEICSDKDEGMFHWRARWKSDETPQITLSDIGMGTATLPTNAYYSPP